jgi:hypothetical protein
LPSAAFELVATNAARQTDTTSISVHHAAIAARKSEQWHQVEWQRAANEMGFETEQIGRTRLAAQILRREWA